MSKVYYNQGDSRWGYKPYTAPGYPNATIKSAGCGPTCAAMIVSSCKETVRPDRMCEISKEQGFRVSGGTSNGIFEYVGKRWGIETKRLHSSYDAHQHCKDGWFVVMCCSAGLWTTGGHYILAVGANDSEIEIYDPYLYSGKFNIRGRQGKVRLVGNSAWVEINTFKANSNVQWLMAFKVGNQQPVVPPTNEPKVKYINTQSLNLNVRCDSNGGAVVGSLPKGTQVFVYAEENGWSKIGEGKWVSSSYLSDTNPKVQASQPVSYNRGTVGSTKVFVGNTIIYSNSNLSGTRYNYLPNTAVKVLENTGSNVDKIQVVKTGRVGYVNTNVYKGGSGSTGVVSSGRNTVGQFKRFRGNTVIYGNSNLSGTRYNYLPQTQVKILQNVSGNVDKVCVTRTGRVGYVNTNVYA